MPASQGLKKLYFKMLPYVPMFGLGLYIIVYALSAADYPGGSINYPNAEAYSFYHNFLCDTMDPNNLVGTKNEARFMAIFSHLILSVSMMSFFAILPNIFNRKNRNTMMIRTFGVACMTAFIFMYTEYHDAIVTITGVLGTMALIPFFIELKNYNNKGIKQVAYLCYALSIVVFFSFETKVGFYYLPFFQKITFVVDAVWVFWTCRIVIKQNKTTLNFIG